jgi:RES domain-containing protein
MVAWRITKRRHPAFDGTGASVVGGRWNSPGRTVIYAADSFAGGILEILAHALRPRTLPGPHHAVRIDIPDAMVAELSPDAVPGWEEKDSMTAREAGDRWLAAHASAALVVPAVPSRPVGRLVLINPSHADAARIRVSRPFRVPWDERLF